MYSYNGKKRTSDPECLRQLKLYGRLCRKHKHFGKSTSTSNYLASFE
jgi:hypothetical protein